MRPHEQRVVDEKIDLDLKLEKLQAFFDTPIFEQLPREQKTLLHQQSVHMFCYSEVLAKRIALFEEGQ